MLADGLAFGGSWLSHHPCPSKHVAIREHADVTAALTERVIPLCGVSAWSDRRGEFFRNRTGQCRSYSAKIRNTHAPSNARLAICRRLHDNAAHGVRGDRIQRKTARLWAVCGPCRDRDFGKIAERIGARSKRRSSPTLPHIDLHGSPHNFPLRRNHVRLEIWRVGFFQGCLGCSLSVRSIRSLDERPPRDDGRATSRGELVDDGCCAATRLSVSEI